MTEDAEDLDRSRVSGPDSDAIAGRKYRARAEAQSRARQRLRAAHREEWDRYYQEALVEVFRERGLGEP